MLIDQFKISLSFHNRFKLISQYLVVMSFNDDSGLLALLNSNKYSSAFRITEAIVDSMPILPAQSSRSFNQPNLIHPYHKT